MLRVAARQQRLIRSDIALLAGHFDAVVAAILLFHLARFDWRAGITYAFFAISGGMAAAALWHLFRGTTLGGKFDDPAPRPVPRLMQAWMWLVAIVTGLWGLAMFIYPQGPWPQIRVWPQDPLTSRLIATMLLTFATGALLELHSAAQARMSLWMFVTYGVGAAAAFFWNVTAGKPVPAAAYAGMFCVLAVGSLALLFIRFREAAPSVAR